MSRILAALCLAPLLTAADYDILIRNARIIDGTGKPGIAATSPSRRAA